MRCVSDIYHFCPACIGSSWVDVWVVHASDLLGGYASRRIDGLHQFMAIIRPALSAAVDDVHPLFSLLHVFIASQVFFAAAMGRLCRGRARGREEETAGSHRYIHTSIHSKALSVSPTRAHILYDYCESFCSILRLLPRISKLISRMLQSQKQAGTGHKWSVCL